MLKLGLSRTALEYGLPLHPETVPLFAQSGEKRRENVEKMIMKRVEAFPQGLISSFERFGADVGVAARVHTRRMPIDFKSGGAALEMHLVYAG